MPLSNDQIRASLGSAADQIMAIVADHEQGGDECFEFRASILDFFADALGFQVYGTAREVSEEDVDEARATLTPERTAQVWEEPFHQAVMDAMASTDVIMNKGIPPKSLRKRAAKTARKASKLWHSILGNKKKPGWDDYRRMWVWTLKECLQRSEK